MIKQFPEVESFFEKDEFTDSDLNELKEKINQIYKKDSERKAAESSINLKLASFILKKEDEAVNNQLPKKKKNNQKKLIQTTKSVVKNSSHKTIEEHFLELTLNKPLIKVSIALRIPMEKLCLILDIDINEVDRRYKFTEKHWNVGKENITKRLGYIKKKTDPNKNKGIRKSATKRHQPLTVFDKAKNYGGVGKLIYIRKN